MTIRVVRHCQAPRYHHPPYGQPGVLAFAGRIYLRRTTDYFLPPPLALSAAPSGVLATPATATTLSARCRLVHLIYTKLREGYTVQSIMVPLVPDTCDESMYRPGKPDRCLHLVTQSRTVETRHPGAGGGCRAATTVAPCRI